MKKIYYSDHLEQAIGELLEQHNVKFIHESQDKSLQLDFFLPEYNVFIEVKQFYSERQIRQMSTKDNVILIQGRKSIEFLKTILNKANEHTK